MTTLIPTRYLFDFEFPLLYRSKLPRINGKLQDWSDEYLLPTFSQLDNQTDFGLVYACWNQDGLAIACRVAGKKRALVCDPQRYWAGDNLRLCSDMRDARSNKRATKYCQQFYFLPTGGGPKKNKPVAGSAQIKRAKDHAPSISVDRIEVASSVRKTGYSMEAIIPSACLSSFDPEQHHRIGLYYILEDRELGQQYPTVGDDLNWHVDPSTWPTAVLVKP